jgi:hypothetical protein
MFYGLSKTRFFPSEYALNDQLWAQLRPTVNLTINGVMRYFYQGLSPLDTVVDQSSDGFRYNRLRGL